MRVIVGEPGREDGRGAGGELRCLGPPALLGNRRGQVQQGQADFGVVWPQSGLSDSQ